MDEVVLVAGIACCLQVQLCFAVITGTHFKRDRVIRILACNRTVDELKRVLRYSKFAGRLSALQTTPNEALAYFLNLVTFVSDPESIPAAIEADPFDNLFLALASENSAALIVSGDRHLLDLESFNHIQVVTPSQAVQVIIGL